MLRKSASLMKSEIVWELVKEFDCYKFPCGTLDTFNNCRETGLMFINMENHSKNVWVYAQRNTDEIEVCYGENDSNNMFDEKAYSTRKDFGEDYQEAARYIVMLLMGGK